MSIHRAGHSLISDLYSFPSPGTTFLMSKRQRQWPARLRSALLLLMLGFCALTSFCLTPHDEMAFRSFAEAVHRWQSNPEFRAIAMDYASRGSAGASSSLWYIPARQIIMTIRSVPGLPEKYAVNPTSQQHYDNFSRGPLSAYLHLCSELDLPESIGVMEAEARKNDLSDAAMEKLLATFKMGFPVANDHGSRQSTAAMFRDTNAATSSFAIRTNIGPYLLEPIREIATELNVPADPKVMTFDQQQAVLDRLDGYIKTHNPQLWRTKQMSDYFGGIWAQVYGPPYTMLIEPVLRAQQVCRILLVFLLAFMVVRYRREGRVRSKTIVDAHAPDVSINA